MDELLLIPSVLRLINANLSAWVGWVGLCLLLWLFLYIYMKKYNIYVYYLIFCSFSLIEYLFLYMCYVAPGKPLALLIYWQLSIRVVWPVIAVLLCFGVNQELWTQLAVWAKESFLNLNQQPRFNFGSNAAAFRSPAFSTCWITDRQLTAIVTLTWIYCKWVWESEWWRGAIWFFCVETICNLH